METFFILLLAAATINAQNLYCTPRSTFELDCNTCTCSRDGKSAACTDMICPEGESKNLLQTPKQVCTPRSTFKDYCNTCSCADDGSSFSCTRMTCDENIWNEDGSLKRFSRQTLPAPENVCEPGSLFKDYCNTCSCADDGQSFACTMMDCDINMWNKDGSLKIIQKFEKRRNLVEQKVCEPGSLMKDSCNKCTCAEDGLSYACTRMMCDENIWNEDGSIKRMLKRTLPASENVCEPKSLFNNFCNTCTCAEDGLTFSCTKMFCDEKIWNQDGSRKIVLKTVSLESSNPKQVCLPKSSIKYFCNTCSCADDGLNFSCTKMFCDEKLWNPDGSRKILLETTSLENSNAKQVCLPKSSIKYFCNTCSCAEDGLSFSCTRMFCDEKLWNPDGSRKILLETTSLENSNAKQVCLPKSSIKYFCNTCSCAEDGLSFSCTRMFCDEKLWNPDGSRKILPESASLLSFKA